MIRRARAGDASAIDAICVRTGDAGEDARGRYSSDDLLPDVWARPYLALEPQFGWVVEEAGAVVGYLLATPDTAAFVERYRALWLPGFADRWAAAGPVDAEQVAFGLDSDRMLAAELDRYPAHLHIDLLRPARGRGWGRALIDALADDLRARGVPGVHVFVDPVNRAARAFYARLGFVEQASGALGLSLN